MCNQSNSVANWRFVHSNNCQLVLRWGDDMYIDVAAANCTLHSLQSEHWLRTIARRSPFGAIAFIFVWFTVDGARENVVIDGMLLFIVALNSAMLLYLRVSAPNIRNLSQSMSSAFTFASAFFALDSNEYLRAVDWEQASDKLAHLIFKKRLRVTSTVQCVRTFMNYNLIPNAQNSRLLISNIFQW